MLLTIHKYMQIETNINKSAEYNGTITQVNREAYKYSHIWDLFGIKIV